MNDCSIWIFILLLKPNSNDRMHRIVDSISKIKQYP